MASIQSAAWSLRGQSRRLIGVLSLITLALIVYATWALESSRSGSRRLRWSQVGGAASTRLTPTSVEARPVAPTRSTVVQPGAWTTARVLTISLCAAVVLLAALVRGYQISTIPHGLHGDEAAYGLEGERILQTGPIGPYSGIGLGIPSGPLYAEAVAVAVLGNTILAVRSVSLVTGVLTVLALFAVMARNLGLTAAVVGSALLGTMAWHIHFSHVGYNLAPWGLLLVLALGALAEAIRTHDWRWWVVAGALSGAGIYQYQVHLVVLMLLGIYLVGHCLHDWFVERASRDVVGVLLFAGALVLVALPMLLYAIDPRTGFLNHYLIATQDGTQQRQVLDGAGDWIRYLMGQYLGFWVQACCKPRVDGADATGYAPLAPLGLLILVVLGIGLALRYQRRPLVVISLLIVVLLPLASVTVGLEGIGRRAFALTALFAMFAGIAVAELVRLATTRGGRFAGVGYVAAALVVGALMVQGVTDYFVRFSGSEIDHQVSVVELTDASFFMRALPPRAHVYFYSQRWSFNYETREFLAPDVTGEDRSTEFGQGEAGIDVDPGSQYPVFVLIGNYRALLPAIQSRYPGGTVTQGGPAYDPTFVAYRAFPVPS